MVDELQVIFFAQPSNFSNKTKIKIRPKMCFHLSKHIYQSAVEHTLPFLSGPVNLDTPSLLFVYVFLRRMSMGGEWIQFVKDVAVKP